MLLITWVSDRSGRPHANWITVPDSSGLISNQGLLSPSGRLAPSNLGRRSSYDSGSIRPMPKSRMSRHMDN
jgi:hypothetical protein